MNSSTHQKHGRHGIQQRLHPQRTLAVRRPDAPPHLELAKHPDRHRDGDVERPVLAAHVSTVLRVRRVGILLAEDEASS